MKHRNPKLLVVEDSTDDERLILRALSRLGQAIDIEVVRDGEEAINLLTETDALALPDLVILDWKLPKMMGADVLRFVHNDPRCNGLVVVAFSSSDMPSDRVEFVRLGGRAFVSKPVDYAEFISAVQSLVMAYGPKPDDVAQGIRKPHTFTTNFRAGQRTSI